MLGGNAVGLGNHFILVIAQDHLPVVCPGFPCNRRGWEYLEQTSDLCDCAAFERFRVCEQNGGRTRPMLSLSEQIRGAKLGINAIIRNHKGLSRASEQVDTNPPKKLSLGLGNVGVSGSDDKADGSDRLRSDGH